MILAGDIGGTKTLIGLFDSATGRPTPVDVRTFATTEFSGLPAIIDAFCLEQPKSSSIDAAVFGIAGPIIDQSAEMTNVEWRVDRNELVDTLGTPHVHLLNDLEAMAYGVPVLTRDELVTLQAGNPRPNGNLALIAAGTGLGEALLHYLDGRYRPIPSEGGAYRLRGTDRSGAGVRPASSRSLRPRGSGARAFGARTSEPVGLHASRAAMRGARPP